MRTTKYLYLYVVQGYYGNLYGWEDLTQSENYTEARADLRDYNDNELQYSHRMIKRREINKEN